MWGSTRSCGVRPPNRNVDHWDRLINAYVDDMLNPDQRLEVEEFLSLHPEVSRRVADYRNQNRGLHELYDRYLSEPLPEQAQHLEQRLVAKMARQSRFYAVARLSAAAAIVVLAVAGGWSGARYYMETPDGTAMQAALVEKSAPAPREAPLAPVKVSNPTPPLNATVPAPAQDFPAPDLRSHGLQLTGSRDIGRPDGTSAHRLIYETKAGLQVTLYTVSIADNGTRKVSLSRRGPIWFLLWNHRGRAHSMIGEVDRDAMLAIGATINAHWGAPAGGQEGVPGNAPPLDAPGSAPAADKLFQLNEKTLIRPAATDEKAVPPEGAP